MAYYKIPDPEELLPCPYDKVHMVAAKRMQYHLMKCRKNFTGREFATCPFNARHEMPKPELRYHIANCPDKAMLEPILSYEQSKMSEDGKNFKGCTDLPKYDEISTRHSENWDEEIPERPRIGVDPAYFARMEYKDLTGMSRSEKKSWKKQFSLPPDQRQYPMQEAKEEEQEGQLRKPHIKPSKYMQTQPVQHHAQVLNYSLAMAGIGRGGAGLAGQAPQGIGRAIGRGENVAPIGRGIGRADNLAGIGRAMAMPEELPGVGRAKGRATAMQNYNQNSSMNGNLYNGTPTQTGMNYSNGNGVTGPPPGLSGLNGQFADLDVNEENTRMNIQQSSPVRNPQSSPVKSAGIGRGRGVPSPTFSVGMGRGMLGNMPTNGSPVFVVPVVPNAAADPTDVQEVPEGTINAELSLDAKNKERKKIEKKLKQIELLEEKAGEGYKYNSEEEKKVKSKENLLRALEELN